ncbi:MAG: hypothetical protein NTV29_10395 [Planctomycetota bacterium]|nr:hypothetical protein [Planctomycetota bacterium]
MSQATVSQATVSQSEQIQPPVPPPRSMPTQESSVKLGSLNKSLSAILLSLCVHLIVLLGMALALIGAGGKNGSGIFLLVASSNESLEAEMTQLDLSSSVKTNDTQETQPLTPTVETEAVVSKLTSLANNASDYLLDRGDLIASGPSATGAEAAAAALASGAVSKSPKDTSDQGYGASFFGTYAPGQRFVFVIDSSSSMLEGTRWPTLRRELTRAIRGLSPDQEFFVISFDISAHPMFNTLPPIGKFLPPTDESLYRLNTWINGIQHQGSTRPASSIGIALGLKPDAIFLLSDGEIQDTTVQELRIHNRIKSEQVNSKVAIPIHTVLLHSPIGAGPLKLIADENDGVFTPVSQFAER